MSARSRSQFETRVGDHRVVQCLAKLQHQPIASLSSQTEVIILSKIRREVECIQRVSGTETLSLDLVTGYWCLTSLNIAEMISDN